MFTQKCCLVIRHLPWALFTGGDLVQPGGTLQEGQGQSRLIPSTAAGRARKTLYWKPIWESKLHEAKAAAALWMKRLAELLRLRILSCKWNPSRHVEHGWKMNHHLGLMPNQVTGKQAHEIHIAACKSLDEVTLLLTSLCGRRRKYIARTQFMS